MFPCHPETILSREPLQWGRDFCRCAVSFLEDADTSPTYKLALCAWVRRDARLALAKMNREWQKLAGGALWVSQGFSACRLLILNYLTVNLPARVQDYAGEEGIDSLRAKMDFLQNLLEEMQADMEARPFPLTALRGALSCLERRGLDADTFTLAKKAPLSVYILPYTTGHGPGMYLRDLHAMLLFGCPSGARERETVVLHEMGHALLANLLRQGPGAAWGTGLPEPLKGAALALTAKSGSGLSLQEGKGAEGFCHNFVRTVQGEGP